MRKLNLLFTGLLFILAQISYSQDFITIKGSVFEKNSDNPIYFANISICNKSIGISSNEFGEFLINVPMIYSNHDICISAIGYETKTILIQELAIHSYNKIFLDVKNYKIEEAVITEKRLKKFSNPVTIVKLAIENLNNNFTQNPSMLQGYYREYTKYKNNNYLNLLETAILHKDPGFQIESNKCENYIMQFKYNEDYKKVDVLETNYINEANVTKNHKHMPDYNFPLIENELTVLFLHDAIRRNNERSFSMVNKFSQDFITNHKFELDKITYFNDIPTYQISFTNNKNFDSKITSNNNINIQGKIYIQSNTYAIQRLEYTSYSQYNSKVKDYEVIIEYQMYNQKMYLKYLSFSNSFEINTSSIYFTDLDLNGKDIPLQINNVYKQNDSLFIEFNNELKKSAIYKKNFKIDGTVIKYERYNTNVNIKKTDGNVLYVFDNDEKNTTRDSKSIKIDDSIIKQYNLSTYITSEYPEYSYFENPKTIALKITYLDKLNENAKITFKNTNVKIGTISIDITGVKDVYGNKIDGNKNYTMYQFRELFINEIKDDFEIPSYARTILTNIPIYDQIPIKIENFWESFNYPHNIPLQDITEKRFKY